MAYTFNPPNWRDPLTWSRGELEEVQAQWAILRDNIITLGPYDRSKKAQYDAYLAEVVPSVSDWRGAYLENSPKRELQAAFITVAERTLDLLQEVEARLVQAEAAQSKNRLQELARQARAKLVEQVLPHKNEYIAGCDDGLRQWECLLDLIESGHVTKENLPEYRIVL